MFEEPRMQNRRRSKSRDRRAIRIRAGRREVGARAPETSQLPSSRSTSGGSSPCSTSWAKVPASAARMLPGVTIPSRWPYSSWTNANGLRRCEDRKRIHRVHKIGDDGRRTDRCAKVDRSDPRSTGQESPSENADDIFDRALRTGSAAMLRSTSAWRTSFGVWRRRRSSRHPCAGSSTSRTGRSASRTIPEMIARSIFLENPRGLRFGDDQMKLFRGHVIFRFPVEAEQPGRSRSRTCSAARRRRGHNR